MTLPKAVTRNLARAMLICFAPFAVFAPATEAAMIGTNQIISNTQAQTNKNHLMDTLSRADLSKQLRNAGVDPVLLQHRIDTLTAEEVAILNEQLDQLPAGGGIIGYSVFIFIVLLMTDIMGYTEIFPFVKKTIN